MTQLEHRQHQARPTKIPVCFLAHDIELATNVGSLFRLADAFALEKIYLSGSSPVPPNNRITKTSRSTEKYVPFAYRENPLPWIEQLRCAGYRIISLEITSCSTDLRDFAISGREKICLVLGSENSGVCQALLDASDDSVHIPMLGENSSMNVATACAIATFEIVRKFL